MGKLLRVLVILLFLLSLAALVFGWLLFSKRELLKGRTQTLEKTLQAVAPFIENEPAVMETTPEDPSRDTSPCESEILETPERSQFWSSYNYNLEERQDNRFNMDKQKLMTYYVRDPEGRVRKNANGMPIKEGPTTMHDLLKDFQKKVEDQYTLLDTTREQLRNLRIELIDTIRDLNTQKGILREKLVKITELEEEIRQLKAKIVELNEKIDELNNTISELRDQIAELERQNGLLVEQIEEKDDEIERLEAQIKILTAKPDENADEANITDPENLNRRMPVTGELAVGIKGTLIDVNKKWSFVAVKLNKATMDELLGEDRNLQLPAGTEMLVGRMRGQERNFVTKISLRSLDAENSVGIFDVLDDWSQVDPRAGDIVFH